MAAYSPISSRSTRNLPSIRRRDSINSSIGATSVRRLIAVVRSTSSRSGPVYSRKTLIRNLVVLCASHMLIQSTFLPFLALQSSVSVWSMPLRNEVVPISIHVGSLLLTVLYFFAAASTILSPSLIQKMGTNMIFLVSYTAFIVFYATHLYPVLYLLVPVYVLLGLALGPISLARISLLMTLSAKISYIFSEDDEDSKIMRRTCIIRRVARAFKAAHDFGFIFGSILSSLVITYTVNLNSASLDAFYNASGAVTNNVTSGALPYAEQFRVPYPYGGSFVTSANCSSVNCTAACAYSVGSDRFRNNCSDKLESLPQVAAGLYDYSAFLDDIFDVDESGERLCGSNACPSNFLLTFNASDESHFHVLPKATAAVLAAVYVGR